MRDTLPSIPSNLEIDTGTLRDVPHQLPGNGFVRRMNAVSLHLVESGKIGNKADIPFFRRIDIQAHMNVCYVRNCSRQFLYAFLEKPGRCVAFLRRNVSAEFEHDDVLYHLVFSLASCPINASARSEQSYRRTMRAYEVGYALDGFFAHRDETIIVGWNGLLTQRTHKVV